MHQWWRGYRHRLVPWIMANWSKGKIIKKTESAITDDHIKRAVDDLRSLIEGLNTIHPLLTPYEVRKLDYEHLITINKLSNQLMLELYGFNIAIDKSKLSEGGRGVFVNKGTVTKGHIVSLYPGTLYKPGDPILFQSLLNPFILRCLNGILVDGKNIGLSRSIYRSSAFRDVIGRFMSCDVTWLSLAPINPLSVGQIVNNAPCLEAANVEYIEIDIPPLSSQLLRFLPYVHFQPHPNDWHTFRTKGPFVVGLLATRDITRGEELYSSYFTIINNH